MGYVIKRHLLVKCCIEQQTGRKHGRKIEFRLSTYTRGYSVCFGVVLFCFFSCFFFLPRFLDYMSNLCSFVFLAQIICLFLLSFFVCNVLLFIYLPFFRVQPSSATIDSQRLYTAQPVIPNADLTKMKKRKTHSKWLNYLFVKQVD